jgi:hypothetical protein
VAFTIFVENHRVASARERVRTAALAALNAAAERDSTRDVASSNRAAAELLGDSLRVAERLVRQANLRADALDKALGHERVATYTISLALDSLRHVADSARTEDSESGARRATFELRQTPYRVLAEVDLPPPPGTGKIALAVALDPIPIEARVSCGSVSVAGARAAAIDVRAPAWARVKFGRVEQTSEVCSRAPPPPPASRRFLEFRRLIIGVGLIRSVNTRMTFGAFLGAGVAIGY